MRGAPLAAHFTMVTLSAIFLAPLIDGFKGGLSAENYISITGASRATTTRDLTDLVAKGALTRMGELRYTRYYLDLEAANRRRAGF